MSDLDNQLKQCGRPTSEEGKKLAEKMNEHHYPLISWGLEMVKISNSESILDNFIEVKRVLKPGGRFLIVNEMYLSETFRERNEECMATERMTIYSPEQLEQLLKDAGFINVSIDLVEAENWLRCLASTG